MRDERLYVRDIAQCIERIQFYTRDGREAFMQTPMIQDAVVRNFEIIGNELPTGYAIALENL